MHSPRENRAATQFWIYVACDHQGNELLDRAAVAEVFQRSSILRPKAFAPASCCSFPVCEQRHPPPPFHEEATTRSRSQLASARGLHYLFERLVPLRNFSGEDY